jgi:hypothetical protein
MESERLGLESRLVRLLDAQAARDAGGALSRVVSALTALVLVPTLVAGVYGANFPIPFAAENAMRHAMFAFMACGGVLTYVALGSIRQSSVTRRLKWQLPGSEEGTASKPTRYAFAGLTGAALGIAILTLVELVSSHARHIRSSTTTITVALACIALLCVVVALAVAAARAQGASHVAIVIDATIVGALLSVALFCSSLVAIASAALLGASPAIAAQQRRRG